MLSMVVQGHDASGAKTKHACTEGINKDECRHSMYQHVTEAKMNNGCCAVQPSLVLDNACSGTSMPTMMHSYGQNG
jgi:hypothetical protein